MLELSVVRDLVAIFGVIAGFSYYVLTVRNSQRNQRQQLETRQAQLFMQIYSTLTDEKFITTFGEVIQFQWDDYDDYYQKYMTNFVSRAKLSTLANYFEGIGVLVKRGLIDITFVDDLMSGAMMLYWEKIQDVVREDRIRSNWPQQLEYVEYLYDQIRSIAVEQHPEILERQFGVPE